MKRDAPLIQELIIPVPWCASSACCCITGQTSAAFAFSRNSSYATCATAIEQVINVTTTMRLGQVDSK
jgi:hypothetical protein